MFEFESHLLCSIRHENVLCGIHKGTADVVEGEAESTMKQSVCGAKGPFRVQKVKQRKVFYIVTELALEFNLADFLHMT